MDTREYTLAEEMYRGYEDITSKDTKNKLLILINLRSWIYSTFGENALHKFPALVLPLESTSQNIYVPGDFIRSPDILAIYTYSRLKRIRLLLREEHK